MYRHYEYHAYKFPQEPSQAARIDCYDSIATTVKSASPAEKKAVPTAADEMVTIPRQTVTQSLSLSKSMLNALYLGEATARQTVNPEARLRSRESARSPRRSPLANPNSCGGTTRICKAG